jgi:hypothetical protein
VAPNVGSAALGEGMAEDPICPVCSQPIGPCGAVAWPCGRRRLLRGDRLLAAAALVIATAAVIAFQPDRIGFPPGHHGWISSESLAMITRAGSDNGFVG